MEYCVNKKVCQDLMLPFLVVLISLGFFPSPFPLHVSPFLPISNKDIEKTKRFMSYLGPINMMVTENTERDYLSWCKLISSQNVTR
jgi:hypothetical protein